MIKDCQAGCSTSHFYGLSDNGLPEIAKLLPVAHEWLRKQNF